MLPRFALAVLFSVAFVCGSLPSAAQTSTAAAATLREQHCWVELFGMTSGSSKGKLTMEYGTGSGLTAEQLAKTEAEAAKVRDTKHIIDAINYLSSQGWVFTGADGPHYFFRRSLH